MERTEAFRLLASADRQLLLHELCKQDGEATVSELAERVAARRHQISLDKISDEHRERASIRLHHTHLSQLAEADVISHDASDETVVLHDDEPVDDLFDAAAEIADGPERSARTPVS
ncbi:DUF7344 domain-containing protein [Natrinema salaciae]|uniref:DUF7344 domain-containing protein n=1 Tax=Natrinema salaciae TaxID=1186196 RepID=A0A1H9IDI3_9EURY|nr:hypothetical protein [Natrinema salaciae]SEQ72617.1 hypothetical protein SAMN04489841_2196 [Natrinema salaciae]